MSIITPHYRSIRELLQGQSFSIDEYQREYKWEEKHIVELINDLQAKFQAAYQPGHETKAVSGYEGYFLGSIIVSKRNGKSYLIDGQQRLTSLTLLLIHLFRESQARGLGLDSILAPLIYSDNYGNPAFNLDIPERLPVIEALFNGDTFSPDGKEESVQTMYARYRDIETQEIAEDYQGALPHFIYWLINRVGLIEIATDNDNYAYAIFETMNDRGKPLSPVDMLKAYLLAPIDEADKRKSANAIWKNQVLQLISWDGALEPERDANCIKAWFRAQFAETIRERKAGSTDKDWELIGTVFHRWARDNAARLPWGKAQDNYALIQRDFPFFAKVYTRILDASKNYRPGLEAIFYNAHNEFTWQNTVLLAPLMPTDDEATVLQKLALVATYLDIWVMRRTVNYVRVTYSSSSYAMYLLCKDIRQKSVPELITVLKSRLAEDEVSFDGVMSKKDRLGISDLHLNQFSRRYIYHLLARLTSFVEVGAGKPDLFDKYVDREGGNPCDIEHIWANHYSAYQVEFSTEDAFKRARDHVSGLLLLPADVNRSYQDKPFQEKVVHYATQNLLAASLGAAVYVHQPKFKSFIEEHQLPFKPYVTFGKAEQQERMQLVDRLVKAVWSPNRLDEVCS
jgi:uncharacterized protein with ParB-like and HNH nuclease domain